MPFGAPRNIPGVGRETSRRGTNLDPRLQSREQLKSLMSSPGISSKYKKKAKKAVHPDESPNLIEKIGYPFQSVAKNVFADPLEKILEGRGLDDALMEATKSLVDIPYESVKVLGTFGSGKSRKQLTDKTVSRVLQKHGATHFDENSLWGRLAMVGIDLAADPLTWVSGAGALRNATRGASVGLGRLASEADDVMRAVLSAGPEALNYADDFARTRALGLPALQAAAHPADALKGVANTIKSLMDWSGGAHYRTFAGKAMPTAAAKIAAMHNLDTNTMPVLMRFANDVQGRALEEVGRYLDWFDLLKKHPGINSADPDALARTLANPHLRQTLAHGLGEEITKRGMYGIKALNPNEVALLSANAPLGISGRGMRRLVEDTRRTGLLLPDGSRIAPESLKSSALWAPVSKSELADYGSWLKFHPQVPFGKRIMRPVERLAGAMGAEAPFRVGNKWTSVPGNLTPEFLGDAIERIFGSALAQTTSNAASKLSSNKLPARQTARGIMQRGGLLGGTEYGHIPAQTQDLAKYGKTATLRAYKQVALGQRDLARTIGVEHGQLLARNHKVVQALFAHVRDSLEGLDKNTETEIFDAVENGRSLNRKIFAGMTPKQFTKANQLVKTFSKINDATTGLAGQLGAKELIEDYFSHMRTGLGGDLDKQLMRYNLKGVADKLASKAGEVASASTAATRQRKLLGTAKEINDEMRDYVAKEAQRIFTSTGDDRLLKWVNKNPEWSYFSTNPAVVASAHMFAVQRAHYLAEMTQQARMMSDRMGLDIGARGLAGRDLREVKMPKGAQTLLHDEQVLANTVPLRDLGKMPLASGKLRHTATQQAQFVTQGMPKVAKGAHGTHDVVEVLPRMVADIIDEIHQSTIRPGAVEELWGKANSIWKKMAVVGGGPLSFGFHTRNGLSNVFNMFMGGMRDPSLIVRAVKIRRGLVKAMEDLRTNPTRYIQERPMDALMAAVEKQAQLMGHDNGTALVEAVRHGVIGVDRTLNQLRSNLAQGTQATSMEALDKQYRKAGQLRGNVRTKALAKVAGQTADKSGNVVRRGLATGLGVGLKPIESSLELGSGIEDTSRLALFLHNRNRIGLAAPEAAMHARALMVDYDDLTPFEQKWLRQRSLIPFYAWFRREASLLQDFMLSNPSTFQKLRYLQTGAWDAHEHEVGSSPWTPQYFKDTMLPIPQGVLKALGNTPIVNNFFNPSTELLDLSVLPPFAVGKQFNWDEDLSAAENLKHLSGTMANPAFNIGLAQLTGKNPYTDQPLRAADRNEIPTPFQKALGWIPGEPPFFARERDPAGGEWYAGEENKGELFQTGMGRYMLESLLPPSRLLKNVPWLVTSPDDRERAEQRFPQLLGLSTAAIDDKVEQAEAYRRLEDLKGLVEMMKVRGYKVVVPGMSIPRPVIGPTRRSGMRSNTSRADHRGNRLS
jgi:hypothetical protein